MDHIEREQSPQFSLLNDLPAPEQIPDGVYIILGSQTDNLGLPSSVKHSIREAERRIEIQRLSRDAVFEIINNAPNQVTVTPAQQDLIFGNCSGHPLILGMVLKQMEACASESELESLLELTEPFMGDIDAYYFSFYSHFESNDRISHLLGILARIRGVIDLRWLESWYDRATVRELRRTVYQFFKHETVHSWYFFHNSFRVYLIDKTREIPPSGYDPNEDIQYHQELANQYATAPDDSPLRWEEFFHRILAKEHSIVVERASQEFFRNQFFNHRPISSIRTDIMLAMQSALEERDVVALCNFILAGAEMAQRERNLELDILPSLFLD